MKNYLTLLLRIALGLGFLSAVADRFGFWGQPGDLIVAWGNWENFVVYTSKLNFGVADSVANVLGVLATGLELILGVLLIIGLRIKYTAFCTGILLLLFALAMTLNTHFKVALDYSVFTAAFAALLLSATPQSKWAVDNIARGANPQ